EMDPAQYAQLSRGKSLDTGRDRTGARQPGRGRQPVRKRLVRLVFVHLSPPQTWWLQAAFGVGHCLELHTIRNTTCPTSSSPIRQVCAGFAQIATICVFSVTQVRANVYTKAAPLTVRGRGTQPNELGGDSPGRGCPGGHRPVDPADRQGPASSVRRAAVRGLRGRSARRA